MKDKDDVVIDHSLKEENERLRAELARIQGRNPTIAESTRSWPKIEKVYLHSNREAMRDLGTRIGLTEAGVMDFKFALYEVAVTLEINEDGSYKVLEHDLG